MALVYLSLALVVGIYFGSHFPLTLAIALPTIAAALLIALLWRKNRPVLLGGICIALFLCGALRYGAVPTGDALQSYIGKGTVAITGVVVEEPEPRDSSTKLILSARKINGEKVSGTLLVRTTRYPVYEYGDLVEVTGELEEPPEDLDGFDYRAYLARQGIYSTMYYPDIEREGSGQGPQPFQAIYSFRHRMGEALGASLSEPQGSLAQGILLGLRHNIPPSLYENFRDSGTAHLLAISGLHMAIVGGILLSVTLWLFGRRRPTYFLVTLSALWLYALLAGMSPSVMRAAIMVSLFIFAAYVGRQRSGITAIAFAAAIMVTIDPQILWQVSFQLSFTAVLGLILLTPTFQQWGRRTRAPTIVVDSFAYSLGAILATLPLVAYYFGYVSLVGLPATFLTVLALPAIIVLSALVGLIGLLSVPVAQVIGWVDWLFLKYMATVVKGFAALPWSSMEIGGMDAYWVWLYYGVLGGTIWLGTRRKRLSSSILSILGVKGGFGRTRGGLPSLSRRVVAKFAFALLLIIAILIWTAAAVAPGNGKLSISFLDVGQGDAALITTPSGQHILVDGGPSPEKVAYELGEALPFWERTIDLVVLTHAHDDHVSGLVEVLRRYEVEQVLYPEGIDYTSNAYSEWLSVIEEKGIARVRAQAGQRIDLGGGATLEVLNPPAEFLDGTESDIDNNGVVLRLEMGEVSFLLTADLYGDGELYLVCERVELRSTVLQVSHHGSSTSTSASFLDAVNPQVAVISVGANNRFGLPSDEVMARLTQSLGQDRVYLTSEQGTITFTTDGERLWVATVREGSAKQVETEL
ncbi:MAG: DNA internalization-related competence protein ComEC/Rec2 [Dehalococcoidia bacterium]|nr:DNA internalization-related competence protein ComEC/Rec2 [Dehalococcoidia bacterium]